MKIAIHGENYEIGCAKEDEPKVVRSAALVEEFMRLLAKQFEIKKVTREYLLVLTAIKLAAELNEKRDLEEEEGGSRAEEATPNSSKLLQDLEKMVQDFKEILATATEKN